MVPSTWSSYSESLPMRIAGFWLEGRLSLLDPKWSVRIAMENKENFNNLRSTTDS